MASNAEMFPFDDVTIVIISVLINMTQLPVFVGAHWGNHVNAPELALHCMVGLILWLDTSEPVIVSTRKRKKAHEIKI